ncbi:MAG: hypothetical protein MJE66_13205 [Proteobacteria bacterium]|nr:hypothetical protein [Pseudomonadota bacterium]
MDNWVLFTLGFAAVVVFFAWRGRRERESLPNSLQATSAPAGSIEDLLLRGRKIEAIKLYREEHGVGLREAKEAVEALERELRS